ncbi:hypothetical protein [Phytobacter sp. AG2a]
MTIYTESPGQGINQPISNVPSGLGESLLSSLGQGFDEGPVMSGIRFAQADVLANDTNAKVVSKSDADAQLKEYGVKSITVPDTGVTQTFLDHVIGERKDSLAKQQVALSAPSGWVATPLNFVASLAGAMADPGNVALAFVPLGGEVRAASTLGRFGERLAVGARVGAAQAVATVPFTAQAAAAEGSDFTYGNALESTFFNTLAGGLMHAGGGLISDAIRARRPAANEALSSEPLSTASEAQPTPVMTPDNVPEGVNIPEEGTTADLATAVSRDAESYAYSRAYNDVVPEYITRQQELQAGLLDNVADLRREIASNSRAADALDATLSDRTSQYQSRRMKYRDARNAAMRDIQAEKDALASRNQEISDSLQQHAQAERARGNEAAISRGEIPDELRVSIDERAQKIRSGLQLSPVSGAVRTAAAAIREADWVVNQQAYRAALAHMMDGRSPDVEPFYDLHKPALRERSIQRIQNPVRAADEGGRSVSESADRVWRDTQNPDHEITAAIDDLDNEINISDALLNDIATNNPEAAASMRENITAIRAEANDDSLGKAFRAFASCMINRGL